MFNGEINIKSINISYSKLGYRNLYEVYFSSNSSITLSTFSNNTSTSGNSEAGHQGSSDSIEFKILYCNYFKNECHRLIFSTKNLYIINCSFNKNTINVYYFYASSNRLEVKSCYFDISDPSKGENVTIIESVDSIYPENSHLSTGLCFAKLKLEFSKEFKVNKKRKNKFNFLVIFVSLVSK